MQKDILILDSDKKQCAELCDLLKNEHFPATAMHSLQNIDRCLEEKDCLAVIIDIDTVLVDNHTIRELTIKFPAVYFFGLSAQPFHPELKDAICYHIYACLNKPVDPEELFYFLRSICDNEIPLPTH